VYIVCGLCAGVPCVGVLCTSCVCVCVCMYVVYARKRKKECVCFMCIEE
jgi:hypothetical protein